MIQAELGADLEAMEQEALEHEAATAIQAVRGTGTPLRKVVRDWKRPETAVNAVPKNNLTCQNTTTKLPTYQNSKGKSDVALSKRKPCGTQIYRGFL